MMASSRVHGKTSGSLFSMPYSKRVVPFEAVESNISFLNFFHPFHFVRTKGNPLRKLRTRIGLRILAFLKSGEGSSKENPTILKDHDSSITPQTIVTNVSTLKVELVFLAEGADMSRPLENLKNALYEDLNPSMFPDYNPQDE
ncbi:hypothetical protein ACH5RR_008923 [Cinchona calisaya]|uniref:Uncharacterized protein n=1 Tax=Cinchona calisaya TaxID=153742 RepID=A0ABD3AF77_9GENT